MPMTSTGLVPSTYRRAMDKKCHEWSPLPKQPKPELYPYRGDYINARNRKLRAKKAAKKPLKKSPVPNRPKQVESKTSKEVDFDTFTQSISTCQLSAGEREAKIRNKERFLDYMRSEASKREKRMTLEKKIKSELKGGDDGTNDVHASESKNTKQKKPPVPRLSHMARTGKRTKSELAKLKTQQLDKEITPGESNTTTKQPKRKSYLDFISRKAEKPRICQNSTGPLSPAKKILLPIKDEVAAILETDKPKTVGAELIVNNSAEDGFLTRIEGIVQKAAAMVMNESNTNSTHHELQSTSFSWLRDNRDQLTRNEFYSDDQQTTNSSELSEVHYRLKELEERIRCLSPRSSFTRSVNEEFNPVQSSSMSQKEKKLADGLNNIDIQVQQDSNTLISDVTYQGRQTNSKQNRLVLESIEDHSKDSSTEVVPRPHIQPTEFQPSRRSNSHGTSNNETFSWSVTLTNGSESTPATEATIEKCSLPQYTTEELPSTMPIQPAVKPLQTVTWEDEPLPRGYESMQRTESNYQVVDDILSLL